MVLTYMTAIRFSAANDTKRLYFNENVCSDLGLDENNLGVIAFKEVDFNGKKVVILVIVDGIEKNGSHLFNGNIPSKLV